MYEHVVLLEETLQNYREVLAENQNLGAELKSRDEEHNNDVLKELHVQQEQLSENHRHLKETENSGFYNL